MRITIDTTDFPVIDEEIAIHKDKLQSLYKGHKVTNKETLLHMLEYYCVREKSVRQILENP